MKKYIPLILVEVYLIITLLVLWFGPVSFKLHNITQFCILIIIYHACFISGYVLGAKVRSKAMRIDVQFSSVFFYISFFFAVLGVFNTYRNLMLASSIIPFNYFEDLVKGISEPGLVYSDRMLSLLSASSSDSRLFNVISILFAFFKLFFIFIFIYFWHNLSWFKKVLSIFYSLVFLSPGLASGINNIIFLFFIFTISSILVCLYVKAPELLFKFSALGLILFLIPVYSFGYVMSQRGGGFDYFATTSSLGDISVSSSTIDLTSVALVEFFYYAFVWLSYYLVQGYYGFSLILQLDFDWTYGFGNSAFLQRQFMLFTGLDVSKLTYQHKISSIWHESAQWHSFYGNFANDFSLPGLALFMFALGYFLSRVWKSIIKNNSFYGAALIPILVIMFLFFPANNQVFGFIDTFSYFIFIGFFWFIEEKKRVFFK